jgi:TolA-binding protein
MNKMYEFNDQMSASDRLAFEQALATDLDLANRLDALRQEDKIMNLLQESQFMENIQQWEQENKQKEEVYTKDKWKNIKAIVLASIVLFMVFNVIRMCNPPIPPQEKTPMDSSNSSQLTPATQNNGDKQAQIQSDTNQPQASLTIPDYYDKMSANIFIPENFDAELLGQDTGAREDNYAKAAKYYRAGQYKAALRLLQQPDLQRQSEFLYLRGYTYYKLGEYALAEQDFRAFRGIPNPRRTVDAVWCEVFCLTRQLPNTRKRLDTVLQELVSNPLDTTYARRARLLKSELEGHK